VSRCLRPQEEAERDRQYQEARKRDQDRVAAVLASVDAQRAAVQSTVDSLNATVAVLQRARDSAAEDLRRTENVLSALAAKVDAAADFATRAVQAEGGMSTIMDAAVRAGASGES
jgi:hypothetical protein